MTEWDDHALLREYAETSSELAFTILVERYLNLVHSTALRRTGQPHAAEEIAQAVFIILAKKAKSLGHKIVLSGWLYQTAQLTAANYLRGEMRRQQREQEAYMQSTSQVSADLEVWQQIAPQLDEAMARLREHDRNAIVLRFFENRSLAEVGAALGASEDAAKMRVNRSLEKLRKIFGKRGITLSAAVIAGVVSGNSMQAAPVGLAKGISAMAITKGATAGGSTLALVKGALKMMAWAKVRSAIFIGGFVLLATATSIVTVAEVHQSKRHLFSWQVFNPEQATSILEQTPPQVEIVPTAFPQGDASYTGRDGRSVWSWEHYAGQDAMGLNCSISQIMRYVCSDDSEDVSIPRTMAATELPDQCYDFIANLKADPKERLRQVIKSELGVVGKFERRPVNALVLTAGFNRSGINASQKLRGVTDVGTGASMLKATSVTNLAKQVELWMNSPVVDQTGISNSFDLTLRWNVAGTNYRNTLRNVLSDQLGLKLVPTNMSIKMLVISKVQN